MIAMKQLAFNVELKAAFCGRIQMNGHTIKWLIGNLACIPSSEYIKT